MFDRLMEPRLHDSYGSSGCSPQGFVLSIAPIRGVGLSRLIRSMKMIPGSPFRHDESTICSNTFRAESLATTSREWGFTRLYSSSLSTAFMKSSVRATEMLKLFSRFVWLLQVMKSRMSGWSTRRMPMFAPRRVPPCLIVSVAASKTVMKEIGPEEIPFVDRTTSARGRRREKEKPVPPPLLWIMAVFLTASKMESIESSTGRTKHAESCCSSRPAFIRVGELGRKSRRSIGT